MAQDGMTNDPAPADWTAARRTMVESQLRTVGVSDLRVLGRFAVVERERFVPADARSLAYADAPVPLGGGRALNPPMATALLIQAAEPRITDRVLLVGAATGYTSAVLAPLVGDLVSLEEDARLAAELERTAGPMSRVERGPLVDGHAAGAPYDLILIDGAVERVSDSLIAQMAAGGRMATGLIERGVGRLCAGRKVGDVLSLRPMMEASVVPLVAFAKPAEFVF